MSKTEPVAEPVTCAWCGKAPYDDDTAKLPEADKPADACTHCGHDPRG